MVTVSQPTYDASTAGTYAVQFKQSWSVGQTHTITATVTIVDACHADITPPASPVAMTYTLYAASQTQNLKPTGTLAYCTYSVTLTTSNAASFIGWSDYSGTLANAVHATVSYSGTYSRSLLGAHQATFTYTWAKTSQALVFDLNIVDDCAGKVHPANLSLSYVLMEAMATRNMAATVDNSYCQYNVQLMSLTSSGNDFMADSLWNWTPATNIPPATAVNFGVHQTTYDPSKVNSYSANFRYTWSSSSTQDATLNIAVTDACPTALTAPSSDG